MELSSNAGRQEKQYLPPPLNDTGLRDADQEPLIDDPKVFRNLVADVLARTKSAQPPKENKTPSSKKRPLSISSAGISPVVDVLGFLISHGASLYAKETIARFGKAGEIAEEELEECAVALARYQIEKLGKDSATAIGVVLTFANYFNWEVRDVVGLVAPILRRGKNIDALTKIVSETTARALVDSEHVKFDSNGDIISLDLRQIRITNISALLIFRKLEELRMSFLQLTEGIIFEKLQNLKVLEIEVLHMPKNLYLAFKENLEGRDIDLSFGQHLDV